MAEHESSAQPTAQHRRSSLAGQTFASIFGNGRSRGSFGESDASSVQPGPITTAATQARNRRMSLTTLGLSSSPDTASRFSSYRNQSLSSSPGSVDESAIEDDSPARESSTTASSFQRRASFGAKAFMDVRTSVGANGQNGEGFNWSDNFRTRAERTSIAAINAGERPNFAQGHERAKSVAVMEPPIAQTPKSPQRPDHFQERILKGDFYMD